MSAKQQTAIAKFMHLLQEWDKGSTVTRKKILNDFINYNQNKTGTEIEEELAHSASLLMTRITAWLRLTFMTGTCLKEQLQAIKIFLSPSCSNKFLSEFLEVGGVLTLLEIVSLRQAKEEDKKETLILLQAIANAGRKYKEIICECYGVRCIAECLARSKHEPTQIEAKYLLENLAKGNPKYQNQVYKGLIALLPCTSPKAQELAVQTLQVVQPIVKESNLSLVEPLLGLLQSLHIEVQYETIELFKILMNYTVKDALLKGLVSILKPPKRLEKPELIEDTDQSKNQNSNLIIFIQQAAAAKAIGILAKQSSQIAEQFLSLQVIHNLIFAMGNEDYPDSQRQASRTLEYFVRNYSIVADQVREAIGEQLFDLLLVDSDGLYSKMTAIQADVCRSNKVQLPFRPITVE